MELNLTHTGETVARAIARELSRYRRGRDAGAAWWRDAESALEYIARELLPSGSGIDSGCEIDLDESKPEKIVIRFGFHHMSESGYYTGWTDHRAIVTPSLEYDFDLRITGRDKNGIKDYLGDVLHHALAARVGAATGASAGHDGPPPDLPPELL